MYSLHFTRYSELGAGSKWSILKNEANGYFDIDQQKKSNAYSSFATAKIGAALDGPANEMCIFCRKTLLAWTAPFGKILATWCCVRRHAWITGQKMCPIPISFGIHLYLIRFPCSVATSRPFSLDGKLAIPFGSNNKFAYTVVDRKLDVIDSKCC